MSNDCARKVKSSFHNADQLKYISSSKAKVIFVGLQLWRIDTGSCNTRGAAEKNRSEREQSRPGCVYWSWKTRRGLPNSFRER